MKNSSRTLSIELLADASMRRTSAARPSGRLQGKNHVEKPEDEGFYDRSEICNLLHIAYPTLWRIEQSGILKCQKVGRK